MTPAALLDLLWQTVTAPRAAAHRLLGLRLGAEPVALALVLVVILNTLVFMLLSGAQGLPGPIAALAAQPVIFALAMGVSVAATVFALAAIGRGLGGTGSLTQVGALVAWLQVLRLVMQIAVGVLAPVLPSMAAVALFFGTLLGLWILLNFVDVVHGYGSLAKAALVLILSFLAIILVLSLTLQAVITPDPNGAFNV